jgi:DNA replication protein DnaD
VVQLACERTVMQTGKASFAYADKILESWKTAGVKSTADVAELDQAFAAKKNQAEQKPAQQTAPKKQNRFINYTQREWDFAELERLEREQREKR